MIRRFVASLALAFSLCAPSVGRAEASLDDVNNNLDGICSFMYSIYDYLNSSQLWTLSTIDGVAQTFLPYLENLFFESSDFYTLMLQRIGESTFDYIEEGLESELVNHGDFLANIEYLFQAAYDDYLGYLDRLDYLQNIYDSISSISIRDSLSYLQDDLIPIVSEIQEGYPFDGLAEDQATIIDYLQYMAQYVHGGLDGLGGEFSELSRGLSDLNSSIGQIGDFLSSHMGGSGGGDDPSEGGGGCSYDYSDQWAWLSPQIANLNRHFTDYVDPQIVWLRNNFNNWFTGDFKPWLDYSVKPYFNSFSNGKQFTVKKFAWQNDFIVDGNPLDNVAISSRTVSSTDFFDLAYKFFVESLDNDFQSQHTLLQILNSISTTEADDLQADVDSQIADLSGSQSALESSFVADSVFTISTPDILDSKSSGLDSIQVAKSLPNSLVVDGGVYQYGSVPTMSFASIVDLTSYHSYFDNIRSCFKWFYWCVGFALAVFVFVYFYRKLSSVTFYFLKLSGSL